MHENTFCYVLSSEALNQNVRTKFKNDDDDEIGNDLQKIYK